MVRNHHDGPDWMPATIVKVLGPVTYLVETDHCQKWKRHADQIKDWLLPAPRVAQETENSNSEVDSDNFETASEVSGPEPDPSTEDTADSSSPGAEPDTESPVEETNPPEAEHSSTTVVSRVSAHGRFNITCDIGPHGRLPGI